jgi:enoyl-CoA hydratase
MSDNDLTGFDHLRWETRDNVAIVWLARPPVNAVNQAMYREIKALFGEVARLGPGVKVIVLAGEGRHFCAGNDLNEFATLTPENSAGRMAEVRAAFFAIQEAPLPVIGAVQGVALGTGLAIAASCDFVVAAETARLGVPEISVGVMGGARHLSRLLPEPWVRWMYLTGEPLPASRLLELGAVVDVVAEDHLIESAVAHAARIARHSGVAIRTAKRSLNAVETMDLQPGYAFEQSLTGELSGHPDSIEAVRATLERRPPRFSSELD